MRLFRRYGLLWKLNEAVFRVSLFYFPVVALTDMAGYSLFPDSCAYLLGLSVLITGIARTMVLTD